MGLLMVSDNRSWINI